MEGISNDNGTHLRDYEGEDRVVESSDLREELTLDSGDEWHVLSGLDVLDSYLNGFYGGEVTVLTGPTKNGKTLFAQTLTNGFAKRDERSGGRNVNCLWFSYEVAPRQFLAQFGETMPVFYLPRQLHGYDLKWLETRIDEAMEKFDVKIVFIDHLHYLIDMLRGGNTSLLVGHTMRQLVRIAQDRDIHLFLIAHSKKVNKDADGVFREPEAGDTRDSSFIEQEANNTIAIWRGFKKEPGEDVPCGSCVKIIHNRRFGVFDQRVYFYKDGPYLKEHERQQAERE